MYNCEKMLPGTDSEISCKLFLEVKERVAGTKAISKEDMEMYKEIIVGKIREEPKEYFHKTTHFREAINSMFSSQTNVLQQISDKSYDFVKKKLADNPSLATSQGAPDSADSDQQTAQRKELGQEINICVQLLKDQMNNGFGDTQKLVELLEDPDKWLPPDTADEDRIQLLLISADALKNSKELADLQKAQKNYNNILAGTNLKLKTKLEVRNKIGIVNSQLYMQDHTKNQDSLTQAEKDFDSLREAAEKANDENGGSGHEYDPIIADALENLASARMLRLACSVQKLTRKHDFEDSCTFETFFKADSLEAGHWEAGKDDIVNRAWKDLTKAIAIRYKGGNKCSGLLSKAWLLYHCLHPDTQVSNAWQIVDIFGAQGGGGGCCQLGRPACARRAFAKGVR